MTFEKAQEVESIYWSIKNLDSIKYALSVNNVDNISIFKSIADDFKEVDAESYVLAAEIFKRSFQLCVERELITMNKMLESL